MTATVSGPPARLDPASPASRLDPISAAVSSPEGLAPFCMIDTVNGPIPWDMWPYQTEATRLFMRPDVDRMLVLKARQLGMSWLVALFALWWMLAHPGQLVVLVSIGEREAVSLMRKVKRLHASLPPTIRNVFPSGAEQTMLYEITHPGGQTSRCMSLPSSSDAGRGETIGLLIGDERPKWPRAAEQEAALLGGVAEGVGKTVMIGTANGMDSIYQRWMAGVAGGWHTYFVSALARPGRTREWVMAQRRSLGALGPQEFPLEPEEAFLASGLCPFDRAALADLTTYSVREPIFTGSFQAESGRITPRPHADGSWRVWEWPSADHDYLIAADVAGGRADGDFSTAAIYDTRTEEQVAAFHGRPEPAVFTRELIRAGHLFGTARPAMIVPESNNHGQAVLALLSGWKYPNIYRDRTFDRRRQRPGEKLGWTTTERSRATLVHALAEGVEQGTLGIRDRAAIGEMNTFVWRETGRGGKFEAAEGMHDDLVIAHGIAAAVMNLTRATTRSESMREHNADRRARMDADPVTGYVAG